MGPTGCKILAVQFIHYFAQDTQLSKSCYSKVRTFLWVDWVMLMNNELGSGGLFFLMVSAEVSRAVRPVCSGYLAGLVTWVLTIELTKAI